CHGCRAIADHCLFTRLSAGDALRPVLDPACGDDRPDQGRAAQAAGGAGARGDGLIKSVSLFQPRQTVFERARSRSNIARSNASLMISIDGVKPVNSSKASAA